MAKVPFSKSNKQEEDKTLLEPMLYLLKVPGKNVRKKLLSSFNVWTKVDEDKGDLISECIFNLVSFSQLSTVWNVFEPAAVRQDGKKMVPSS